MPVAGRFDVAHLRAIHQSLFQDVFAWAGQFRIVNISKGGQLFALAAFIETGLQGVLEKLAEEQCLQGSDPKTFSLRSGFYMGEINAIHPFRDGNGRAQREFIRQLARLAGFLIDWSKVTREQMLTASIASFKTGASTVFFRNLSRFDQ